LADQPVTRGAHDAIADRDTQLTVEAALRALPVEQTAAVVLVDIEGFSVEEASRILDVPGGTVKSRCARARARLAVQLHDLDPRGGVKDRARAERNEAADRRVETKTTPDNPTTEEHQ
jgi:RNA polymerase sigma-70 factor (ECF subfamily)